MPKPRDYEYSRVLRYYHRALADQMFEKVTDLQIDYYPSAEPLPWVNRTDLGPKKLQIGDRWGTWYDCAWFRFSCNVDEFLEKAQELSGHNRKFVLLIDVEGECLLYDRYGNPLRGMSSVGCRTPKIEYVLSSEDLKTDHLEFWADCGSNDLYWKKDPHAHAVLKKAELAISNEKVKHLFHSNRVVESMLKFLPKSSARYAKMFSAYLDAAHAIVDRGEQAYDDAISILDQQLALQNKDYPLSISAIGHGHLDLAWLWPMREAVRKAARTLSSACYLTSKFPNTVFGASQPQMLDWMKKQYPSIYANVKTAVKENRIEPQGAMWVEADTHLPCGEALIRQIYYGKQFIKKEFDMDMDYAWLPDVFGFSAALPQILKKSGVEVLFTQKMSWNEVNPFPHDSFVWEGIDSSTVLTHFFPEHTYNGSATPESAHHIEHQYKDKDVSSFALMVYGDGDGGGGPGEAHYESIRRMQNLQGIAPIRCEPVRDFIKKWRQESDQFSRWRGELYLECHHGTYTTLGKTKRYNRKTEWLIRDLEIKSALLRFFGLSEFSQDFFDEIWKDLLFTHFHDVVPGSSIKRVYDETWETYENIQKKCREASLVFWDRLKPFLLHEKPKQWVLNTLSWDRMETFPFEGKYKRLRVPAMGFSCLDQEGEPFDPKGLVAKESFIKNEQLTVCFDEDGCIDRCLHHDQSVLSDGKKLNDMLVYRDIGDAWDFVPTYREFAPQKMRLTDKKFYTEGYYATALFTYQHESSIVQQKVSVKAGEPLIYFDVWADWKSTMTMLRTKFEHDIYTDEAVCDIQFGNIKRPITDNTTWEMAKNEFPTHKWIDVSDGGQGVAVMSDCKYGYFAKNGSIELNLIRSVEYGGCKFQHKNTPKGEYNHDFTDQCTHEFSYALYFHKGDYIKGGVVQKAYEYHLPMETVHVQGGKPIEHEKSNRMITDQRSMFRVSSDHVIIETIKNAYDHNGIIVRLYECGGKTADCSLFAANPLQHAIETDLQERKIGPIDLKNLHFDPYEIKTIALIP